MDKYADIATIIGGIAILVGFISWLWRKRESLKIILRNFFRGAPSYIIVFLDSDYHLSMSDEDLKIITQEALFRAREGQDIMLRCEVPELETHRQKLKTLLKQTTMTPEELEVRNNLQFFLNKKDKRLRYLESIITNIVKESVNIFTPIEYGDDDWKDILKGLVNRVAGIGKRVEGTKIDIWKDKPTSLTAPINVSDEEMKSILDAFNLSYPQQLAMGPGNYFAGDLPREIIINKAIPAIAMALNDEDKLREAGRNEIEQHYVPYGWYVGLG